MCTFLAKMGVSALSILAVFAIYVEDALGYTCSISVMVYKELAQEGMSKLDFFVGLTYFMSVLGAVLLAASCLYFLYKIRAVARAADQGEPTTDGM